MPISEYLLFIDSVLYTLTLILILTLTLTIKGNVLNLYLSLLCFDQVHLSI